MKDELSFKVYTGDAASRKITAETVRDLFGKCILNESDFTEEGLQGNFREGEGITEGVSVFSAERLNDNREILAGMVEELPLDSAPSVDEIAVTSDGEKWAESVEDIDKFLRLCTASELMFFVYSRQVWPYLKNGIPFVGKQLYDVNRDLCGMNAKTYEIRHGSKKAK